MAFPNFTQDTAQCAQLIPDGLSISSTVPTNDPLVLGLASALRSHLDASSSLRDTMEMKHVLLLLVKSFHNLCQMMAYEKKEWIGRIREVVGQEGGMPNSTREHTGAIIISKIEAAPWGLVKRPGQARSDTAHTILAVYKAMVVLVQALEEGLRQKAEQGVDLKKYEVEEMLSDEDEDEPTAPPPTAARKIPRIIIHPPKPPKPTTASPAPSTTTRGPGSGNHNHGMFTVWTIAEWCHLLRTFQNNPTALGKEIAQMHNDNYWVPKGRTVKRSTDAVRQQYKRLIGGGPKDSTIGKVGEKIKELEEKARVANGGTVGGEEGEGGDEDEDGDVEMGGGE
ncbi:hypothetical protein PRZ48_004921 [Zasmidium cellare]|uniref:Uncharacterized protein n=1 Tax=Zasmidium cellare TaxID=395010 RepID=A0ABR0ESA2_ZASCE|nr:hypothetical protein PRZ48_004921 [Zasmidium cellare]